MNGRAGVTAALFEETPEPLAAVADPRFKVGGRYAWYVLGLATLICAMSLLDRQIFTIVAGELKADLKLGDAEVGLLYGTVFAVFYAVFGIPLGRLADGWNRSRLLALGVAGWSLMTILSGLAGGFGLLALARSGVAVGEAVANPAAFSLISDWFPKSRRATALAVYSCGVSLGLGASLAIGGAVLDVWKTAYGGGAGAFGLHGWQAALLVIGAPGLAVAAWAATLREPPRGLSDATPPAGVARPFARALDELLAILPLASLVQLRRLSARPREFAISIGSLLAIVAAVATLTRFSEALVGAKRPVALLHLGSLAVTSHGLQWATLGLGAAVTLAWVQSLRLSDRPTYVLLWRTPVMVALTAASALFMTINYGLMAWSALYAIGRFHAAPSQVGVVFGAIAAGCGMVGTLLGGWLADRASRFSPRGRLWVSLSGMVAPWPLAHLVYGATSLQGFYLLFPWLSLATTLWLPGVAATCQELVLPRMRGAAAATYNLAVTMVGLGLGPFLVGLISDRTGSLANGVLAIYWLSPLVWLCMAIAIRGLPRAEAERLERARLAGEAL